MAKGPFLTFEDCKMAFSLFTCMCGVGTLSMPGNFARAGMVLGFFAVAFMGLANIYASVSMSRVLLLAPNSVKTFGDLGEWAMGKTGRWLCVISQMGSCLLIPCVFLVLGGGLLDGLFPGAFSTTTWIILMTITVLPLSLVPTLKEGAGAAFAACMGTIIADILGVGIILHGMRGHPSVPSPDLNLSQVAGAFGSLAMGFGAGIVLSDLQRQHSDPSRMPRVVVVTMFFIMFMLMALGFAPYSAIGCQVSGNLLYVIYPDASTGLTELGFAPNWGMVVLAYLVMQMHITIAFSVLINPAFFIAERLVLGMHKKNTDDIENGLGYQETGTPMESEKNEIACLSIMSDRISKASSMPDVLAENHLHHNHEAEVAEYQGANAIKYIVLRVAIIAVLVVLSIIFKDHFSEFVDFVGASAITTNCVILPITFYLVKTWEKVPAYERVGAAIVLVVCTVLGCYSTYTAGKGLFFPSESDAIFPYCDDEYENTVYYNYTACLPPLAIILNSAACLDSATLQTPFYASRTAALPIEATMTKEPFFTVEDIKVSFNLFCCVCGVGTLGMPGNYARAGPIFATIAMIFMAFANVYPSIAMSKVMLLAPKSVKTFGDLGEWAMGKVGRWLCVVSQMVSCLLIPCVFLVLGGGLLDGLFPGAFDPTVWTILMATMVLPLCLVPTLEEGSGTALAGCIGTLVADAIGVAVVMHGMRGHSSIPTTDVTISQVAGTFGNLALSYGAGTIIPDLQRQHSDPHRMPRIIAVTLVIISALFFVLSIVGYMSVGCQGAGNLLYTIYPNSVTGVTSLGFAPHWGAVVLAYLFMQLHTTTAFSVLLQPAFYMAECTILGMHKKKIDDVESGLHYVEGASPVDEYAKQTGATTPVTVDDNERHHDREVEAAEYRGANVVKYIVLRICIVVVLVVLSIVFQDHFSDFADFVGASSLTTSCILLPIAFYLVKAWDTIPTLEKVAAIVVFVVCFIFGCYSTYTAGKKLFAPSDSSVQFPYCEDEFKNRVYYNYTAVHMS
ncbi:hypothetical protein BBO99_00001779 [Phytophthora kernoviae]|uniref:Amino acid transporter transmembrane domain-containing protein n=2 Tax=Phytophthora kernoviae TaxID=325452 RepID=A0A3R7GQ91_9STRA|nr:hypothetical protein G195_008970 [Phytophthora kernoviae 00238/432]KAG2526122.1 hypothetical protein JM16_004073 [Phytophthora kernoviae]KAG2532069.1 hypothetical protein JM18_001453 [Phytophthora kernoviae]RLN27194.1 hypothetical protein BBI17_001550 [Phytophthora kernoviae]RLN83828.1 hypothetical protein BBO99_00001779 [Phytophthora kernoviae]